MIIDVKLRKKTNYDFGGSLENTKYPLDNGYINPKKEKRQLKTIQILFGLLPKNKFF